MFALQPIVCILTHPHYDHVGGSKYIKDVFGWQSAGLSELKQKGRDFNLINVVLEEKAEPINENFSHIKTINQEIEISILPFNLKILYTPGHTTDSISIYESSQGWLFTGDTAYNGPIYLHNNDSSLINYKTSIDRLSSLPVDHVFPGHNSVCEDSDLLLDIKELLRNKVYKSKYKRLSLLYRSSQHLPFDIVSTMSDEKKAKGDG
jgi:glyoxylase-like metal-dependent hydrolase (beta-lactamase superfamily II)